MSVQRILVGVNAALLLCAAWIAAAVCGDPTGSVEPYAYAPPPEIGDGWPTASLVGTGADIPRLEMLVDAAREGTYDRLHGVLIVHQGALVFEEYFPGYRSVSGRLEGQWVEYSRATKHECQSATKSFRSALVGIAIDQGLIENVDVPISSFFPGLSDLFTGEKSEITLRHLLTMSSGLDWPETSTPYPNAANPLWQMYQLPRSQWARFVFEQPMAAAPGTVWNYNTGLSILIKEILDQATGITAESFADNELFLRMESYRQRGFPFVDFVLPRDMAKFGQVFLSGGWWKQTQVISEEWIDASRQRHFTPPWSAPHGQGYGFLWWIRTLRVGSQSFDAYFAHGNGGQSIWVIEELDLAVVFTGGYFGASAPLLEWLEQYVLPAMLGGGAS
jgi:CubicO group peptidase (beta-lactamase class C family)